MRCSFVVIYFLLILPILGLPFCFRFLLRLPILSLPRIAYFSLPLQDCLLMKHVVYLALYEDKY